MSDLFLSEVERRAREIWAERELTFPAFVRQTWDQGTDLAKQATLAEALRQSGVTRRAETGTGSGSEASSTRSAEGGGAQ